MSDDQDFQRGDANSTDTIPSQAGAIKKNGYCMLKEHPCKVIEYSTAKPGKHGSAKATIVGTDIFTGKRYEDSCPTSANVRVPIVNKVEYEVADIDEDGFASLILPDGSLKNDLKVPADQDIHDEIMKVWDTNHENATVLFTIISACGQEKIISARCKE